MAVRRNPNFRFDYFLRSLPVDVLARRCEQLMKAAEKEVEQLERKEREHAGLPVEPKEGEELPAIALPKFRVIQARQRKESLEKAELEKAKLVQSVEELEAQMREVRERLRALNEGSSIATVSPESQEPPASNHKEEEEEEATAAAQENPEKPMELEKEPPKEKEQQHQDGEEQNERLNGAIGPDGEFVEFPEYDGTEEPPEWKKPFTHFCIRTRKQVKATLDPMDRKNKVRSHLSLFVRRLS